MKKIVSGIVAFLMVFVCALSGKAALADTEDSALMDVKAELSEGQMTMILTVPANAGVAGGKIAFNYDADKLELVSFKYDGFTGAFVIPNTNTAGRIVVSLASVQEITSGGSLIAVFGLKENTYDNSYIEFTDYQLGSASGETLENLTMVETVPVEVECTHSFGNWDVTKAASCTETGERTHVCKICGETVTETIAALGHTEGEWVVVKEASEREEGLKELYCTACNALLKSEVLPVITPEPEETTVADSSNNDSENVGDVRTSYIMLLLFLAVGGFAAVSYKKCWQ